INYVTPIPPQALAGRLRLAGGGRDFFEARGQLGGKGILADFMHKEGDGARDNIQSQLEDLNLKALLDVAPGHRLILRANRYREDSDVTYSGLTDAEYRNFGNEYNPFDNDTFNARRYGGSATHEWTFGERRTLTTHVYVSHFSRDWWRQASTTTDTQCNATTYPDGAGGTLTFQQAREAGLRVDPDDCASAQGRLRDYYAYGIEPRLSIGHALFGLDNDLQAGLRFLRDTQDRVQLNATSPRGRDGVRSESNKRETDGMAAYVQNRFASGPWSVTPGVRVESVDYMRRNRLTGEEGENDLTEVLPSLGASLAFSSRYIVFAGVHKGFAPPRTEDVVSSTGGSVDVDAEESLNAEIGLRARPADGLHLEATVFRNDFENLVAVGSIAGGGVPLSQGEVLFQGYELSGRADLGVPMRTPGHNPFVELAYTALPKARTEEPFIRLDDGTPIPDSEDGRRLPYAPRHTVTATLGYEHRAGFDIRFETVFVDEQYTDFAGTREAPLNGNGQVGEMADYTVYNLSANYRPAGTAWTIFATAKNLTDKEYIVDRTRGILTGMPRLVYGGVEYAF
ncbi:MAG TPA: TonB-dependent receptor, partial [Nevskiaceae bacterium]|nr:TonB-dependent receptor [Nevskiaceae bacterium]